MFGYSSLLEYSYNSSYSDAAAMSCPWKSGEYGFVLADAADPFYGVIILFAFAWFDVFEDDAVVLLDVIDLSCFFDLSILVGA